MKDGSKPLKKLRWELFCQEYAKAGGQDGFAGRAWMAASGAKNPRAAAVTASRLLKKANVDARWKWILEDRTKRLGLEADDILAALKDLGFFDIMEIFDEHGAMKDPEEWPKGLRLAVRAIKIKEEYSGEGESRTVSGRVIDVSFVDKVRVQHLLAKHKRLLDRKDEGKEDELTLEELVVGSNEEKPKGGKGH